MANSSIHVRSRFDLFKSLTSVDLNIFNKEVHFVTLRVQCAFKSPFLICFSSYSMEEISQHIKL